MSGQLLLPPPRLTLLALNIHAISRRELVELDEALTIAVRYGLRHTRWDSRMVEIDALFKVREHVGIVALLRLKQDVEKADTHRQLRASRRKWNRERNRAA